MKLIENASHWHKLWSLRLAILTAIFAALEASLAYWNTILPPGAFAALATFTGIGSAVARVVKQAGLADGDPAAPAEGAPSDAGRVTH